MFVLNLRCDIEKMIDSTEENSLKMSEERLKAQAATAWLRMEKCLKMNSVAMTKKGVDADVRDITRTEI